MYIRTSVGKTIGVDYNLDNRNVHYNNLYFMIFKVKQGSYVQNVILGYKMYF